MPDRYLFIATQSDLVVKSILLIFLQFQNDG